MFRAVMACLLLAAAAPALAQSPMYASMAIDPFEVAAGVYTNVTISLSTDFEDLKNIAFTGALPSGVDVQPGYATAQCGGTFSATATTFKLTGAKLPTSDDTCAITFRITSRPTVDTDYTLDTGIISFVYGPSNTPVNDSGTSEDFRVLAGVPPEFTDSLPYDGNVGIPYYYYIYFDQGTEPITVTVTGLPPGLTFDPANNRIVGTPTTVGTYMTTITANNGFGGPVSATYAIRIDAAPMSATKSFSPSTITTGGTSKMTIVLTFTDTYAYGVGFTDNFPAGMTATPTTFSACGEGTVTVTANSVRLTDGYIESDESGSGSCTIEVEVKGVASSTRNLVNNTGPIGWYYSESPLFTVPGATGTLRVLADAPRITSGPPKDGLVGGNYLFTVTVTGTTPIATAVTGLPPGLTYNSTTRTINGVPTKAGSYAGAIVASNGISPDARQAFTIVIKSPPLVITTDTLPPISGGSNVNVPIAAVGGIPPYTFDVLAGSLPPGLAFTPAGFLTGVPTLPGTYAFTVQVTDSAGTKATHAYTIVIDKSSPGFLFDVAPAPAVSGEPVVITATLAGGAGGASGPVQVWVAHSYERCPVESGAAPPAVKTETASLGASGQVKFTFTGLTIDNYTVCGTYGGDVRHKAASAGPVELFVIKGALLGTPAVAMRAPIEAKIGSAVAASVTVSPLAKTDRMPQGNVVLRANGAIVATLPLVNGVALFTATAPAAPGAMVLTASYHGDGGYSPASSSAAVVAVKATLADPQPVPTLSALALALLLAALGFSGARAVASQRRR